MEKPKESKFFAEFRKKISGRSDAEDWRYEYTDRATLTLPAKSSEIGDLVVYDDQEELTLAVGEIYHTHFNPKYGPSFDRAVITDAEHIAGEAMKFIEGVLQDQTIIWICFYEGKPVSGGACPENEIEEYVPDNATLYVWSGRREN